ncbi:MAG: ABC transporter permease [Clostridiales bacterium]|nr:ABC transporter permease [Clostridiales bacterium]
MKRSMEKALIRKDIRAITANRRLFSALLIVPLVMTVLLPTVLICVIAFAPLESEELQSLATLLPANLPTAELRETVVDLVFNSMLPLFFLMIPIMAASVMAASSFVGEKEKRTLETLLYCPMSLRQIFYAKILAAFLLSMAVSLLSFVAMLFVVEAESFFLMEHLILPNINWIVLLLLVSPAVSLLAITLIVQGSAKAQTVEEAQQRGVFLVLPVILLAAAQFSGLLLLSIWIFLIFGILCAAAAIWMMRRSYKHFTYETLLK